MFVCRKARLQSRRVSQQRISEETPSDDDMLILNDNNEIVRTCKPGELEEEDDEYIYETLDDPDSLTEMMKAKPPSEVKPKAIRSGGPLMPAPLPSRVGGSGRIRKVTPKMQNSIIAKKLKQAQTYLNTSVAPAPNFPPLKSPKRVFILNKTPVNKPASSEQTAKNVATVSPNSIKVDKKEGEEKPSEESTNNNKPVQSAMTVKVTTPPSDEKKTFKLVKLKGRNPMIFSPDQLPEIQEFLKSESAATPVKDAQAPAQTPTLKIRSVDNLNNQASSQSGPSENNMDIIHSVGLVRKGKNKKYFSHLGKVKKLIQKRPNSWKIVIPVQS